MTQVQTGITRRRILQGAVAAGSAGLLYSSPWAFAQGAPLIRLQKLHCFELRVSDPERSLAFYQDLFGMRLLSRFGGRISLQIGDSSQLMSLRACGPDETPAITHIGFSVQDYNLDALRQSLDRLGYARGDAPRLSEPGIQHTMKQWVRMRSGTPELYFSDARGLIVQLVDGRYCGGSGPLGADCAAPEPVKPGIFQLAELNHFTAFVSDGAGANRYWQETFGLRVQAEQGPGSAVNGIGDGFQFVMFAGGFGGGGRNAAPTPANLHHGSINMHGFDEHEILEKLTDYGLQARGDGPVGPMMHYVSRRMPERGGAEGGTPEVYFTDPDGILMQVQDITYCGGGGYLGSECRA